MTKYTLLKHKLTGDRSIRINKRFQIISEHQDPEQYTKLRKLAIKNIIKAQKDQVMRSCGLVKVKGSLGSVFWE